MGISTHVLFTAKALQLLVWKSTATINIGPIPLKLVIICIDKCVFVYMTLQYYVCVKSSGFDIISIFIFLKMIQTIDWWSSTIQLNCSAGAHSLTVKPTGCGFDPHLRRISIYLNLYFHFFALASRQSAALSSATHHAMPPEFGRKWATKCLNTRFPLPALLCAGYSVKLIYLFITRRFTMALVVCYC